MALAINDSFLHMIGTDRHRDSPLSACCALLQRIVTMCCYNIAVIYCLQSISLPPATLTTRYPLYKALHDALP